MDRSVVIIGAGLGGLFTGAFLSKEGIKVSIVEKNATIGGGLQSFKRFGEVFDTGMHVISGMQPGGNIRRLCDYLGISDSIHIKDADNNCIDRLYFAEDRRYYDIAKGKTGFVESLARYFPDQRDNLTRYVDAMYTMTDELDFFHLRPSSSNINIHPEDFYMSADAFVAKYISNEHLRSVVSYTNPFYGGRGNMTPAFVHAIISVLYINGPSRFAGGSYLFAETLRKKIEEWGGTIITSDPVVKINTQERQITSVSTKRGLCLTADYYISDIHPCTLISLLDNPKVFPKSYRERLDSIPNSYSAFTLNIKLKPDSFPYINHTEYYMSRYDDIWNFGDSSKPWPLGFIFITPPEINQGPYANKIIVTAPMTWKHVQPWEQTTYGHRTEEYEEWKIRCMDTLLDCMEEMYPNFRSYIEDVNTASPLTIRDFYGVKEGAMCGFSKDYKNLVLSQVPVVTKIPNLILTGQCNNLHGFSGVPLTAITSSEVILGRNYILNKLN